MEIRFKNVIPSKKAIDKYMDLHGVGLYTAKEALSKRVLEYHDDETQGWKEVKEVRVVIDDF